MNLSLCMDMNGCPNRCKHCWIGHMTNNHLSDNDAKMIVNRFNDYFDKITVYSWLREPDYCENFRERWLADNELSTGYKPQRFELASFYKIVREPEYVKLLKEVGTKKVQLTLFGLEEITDKYVGRKGAFREILKATEILIANDISPRWQLFINEENKDEIAKLLELIKELRFKERCSDFTFFIHEGSCDGENAKLYDLRIKKESVSESLIPYYLNFNSKQKEQDLVEQFKKKTQEHYVPSNDNGDIVIYVSNMWNVFFNFTNMSAEWVIGNLMHDDIAEICRRIKEEDIPALHAAKQITLSELAIRYGNPDSTRLFDEDDYKMFLLNRYLVDIKCGNCNHQVVGMER